MERFLFPQMRLKILSEQSGRGKKRSMSVHFPRFFFNRRTTLRCSSMSDSEQWPDPESVMKGHGLLDGFTFRSNRSDWYSSDDTWPDETWWVAFDTSGSKSLALLSLGVELGISRAMMTLIRDKMIETTDLIGKRKKTVLMIPLTRYQVMDSAWLQPDMVVSVSITKWSIRWEIEEYQMRNWRGPDEKLKSSKRDDDSEFVTSDENPFINDQIVENRLRKPSGILLACVLPFINDAASWF